jgi:hypothetical protein
LKGYLSRQISEAVAGIDLIFWKQFRVVSGLLERKAGMNECIVLSCSTLTEQGAIHSLCEWQDDDMFSHSCSRAIFSYSW